MSFPNTQGLLFFYYYFFHLPLFIYFLYLWVYFCTIPVSHLPNRSKSTLLSWSLSWNEHWLIRRVQWGGNWGKAGSGCAPFLPTLTGIFQPAPRPETLVSPLGSATLSVPPRPNGTLPGSVEIQNNTIYFKGPVSYSVAGTYVCEATNAIGTRSGLVEVNVTGRTALQGGK